MGRVNLHPFGRPNQRKKKNVQEMRRHFKVWKRSYAWWSGHVLPERVRRGCGLALAVWRGGVAFWGAALRGGWVDWRTYRGRAVWKTSLHNNALGEDVLICET